MRTLLRIKRLDYFTKKSTGSTDIAFWKNGWVSRGCTEERDVTSSSWESSLMSLFKPSQTLSRGDLTGGAGAGRSYAKSRPQTPPRGWGLGTRLAE